MQRRHAFITLLAAACVALPAAAQDRGTRDEAKAMADAAWAHMKKVGYEQANKDFTTDKATWTKKDLYVIVFDTKGVFQASRIPPARHTSLPVVRSRATSDVLSTLALMNTKF